MRQDVPCSVIEYNYSCVAPIGNFRQKIALRIPKDKRSISLGFSPSLWTECMQQIADEPVVCTRDVEGELSNDSGRISRSVIGLSYLSS